MMEYRVEIRNCTIALLLVLLFPCRPDAADLSAECRPLEVADVKIPQQLAYSDALLWEIRKGDIPPSYLFGTIHVSDAEIVNVPEPVSHALSGAALFIMEALPEPDEIMQLTKMMFFDESRRLSDVLSPALFDRAVEILASYQIPADTALTMKPWAAFMVMNYPPGNDLPLDLKLLYLAEENGIATFGLETLQEQGRYFDELEADTQLGLLVDTVCHYDHLLQDFEQMKLLYSRRDLNGLHALSQRYMLSQEETYRNLNKKLLSDRNIIMTERVQPMLMQGNAFIAVGALHLAGNDGVLSLLVQKGYVVKPVY